MEKKLKLPQSQPARKEIPTQGNIRAELPVFARKLMDQLSESVKKGDNPFSHGRMAEVNAFLHLHKNPHIYNYHDLELSALHRKFLGYHEELNNSASGNKIPNANVE